MNKQTLDTLDVSQIEYDDQFNCRGRITPVSCRELAESIKLEGLLQPITVAPKEDGTFKIITGHRRFIATAKVLRRKKINAIIDPELVDPEKAKIVNLTENIQRNDLTLIQELKSIQSMMSFGISKEDIARRCGKSKGWVGQRMKIRDLPAIIQQELNAGLLKMSQINDLHDYSMLNDKSKVFAIAKEMKHKNANHRNFDRKKYLSRTNKKTTRSHREIQATLQHFLEYFEPSLVSRMLAWASGEIDDNALHSFIERFAQENDFELKIGIESYQKPF